jgi:hypothetical protein
VIRGRNKVSFAAVALGCLHRALRKARGGALEDFAVLNIRHHARSDDEALRPVVDGQTVVEVVGVHEQPKRNLLAIAQALRLAGFLTRLREHREQYRRKDGDNRDHDQ